MPEFRAGRVTPSQPEPRAMKALSTRYPIWFCDVWGVVHNGNRPFPEAVAALRNHRQNGGLVVLLTNSPRTRAGVAAQLAQVGVDPACHDLIVTSGDVTQELVRSPSGRAVFHLGPDRDRSIFDGLDVKRVPLAGAQSVLCTGLVDDQAETPDDYAGLLAEMRAMGLRMICANPDKIVRKGDRILHCAGALAERYASLGGEVMMAGKPFAPIYDVAMARAEDLRGRPIAAADVLAIGDGPETDIRGAADFGLDAVLIADGVTDASAGLAAAEAKTKALVPKARIVATLPSLAWS